jgi:predicted PurR-regulated permease PerM
MHVNIRSSALALLCLMAFVVFLQWAREVLIPITLAILVSYALTPVVTFLRRRLHLPKAIGAALTFLVLFAAIGWAASKLQPEAINILDLVPKATQKFSGAMKTGSAVQSGAVAKLQEAAGAIEKAANSAPPSQAAHVSQPSDMPAFHFRDYLLVGTAGVAAGIGQLIVVLALVYFLLVAGDSFRRTLLRVSDATLTRKKITLQILDEIDHQIQRYLLVQIGTSALLGALAWPLFHFIGLEQAGTWAVLGAILHLIPYVGPAAFIAMVGLVAYVQFDTLQPLIIIVVVLTAAISAIALLIVPWLTERVASLNAITVFIALLVWGWLWGVWGLLLGVPVVMALKAVCDRVDSLQGISAFLGDNPSKRSD